MPNNDNHFIKLTFGDLSEVEALLKSGVNPNIQDTMEKTPLHYANTNRATLLLQHKANPNIQDDMGQTPLHAELMQRNIDENKVILLLQHGANLNIQDNFKDTPLQIVMKNRNIELIKLLLQYGQNITSTEQKELVKLLLHNNDNDKNSLVAISYKKLFSLDHDYEIEGDNITSKILSNNKELNITFDILNKTVTNLWENQSTVLDPFETELGGDIN